MKGTGATSSVLALIKKKKKKEIGIIYTTNFLVKF